MYTYYVRRDWMAWEYKHSMEEEVDAKSIWALYSDVSSWPAWDKGIGKIELDGDFRKGAKGTITLSGQGPLHYVLLDVTPNSGFSDETDILDLGLKVRFVHSIEDLHNGKTRITHKVYITGKNVETMGPKIGPLITDGIPEAMESLVKIAKKGSK